MTERRTVLDWAEQIDSEPRATQRGTTWAELRAVARIPPNPTPGEPAVPDLFAHLPGALQQTNTPPAPIAFPDRPATARTDEPTESTRRRWARLAKVEAAAREAAHADGLRQGYTQGWRWGLGCGVPLGALLAGVAWGLWLAARGIAP